MTGEREEKWMQLCLSDDVIQATTTSSSSSNFYLLNGKQKVFHLHLHPPVSNTVNLQAGLVISLLPEPVWLLKESRQSFTFEKRAIRCLSASPQGRSVNDLLATAGGPVGQTRVRRQSVCPSRSLIIGPSGKPLRMLKKGVFVEDSWLCTGTKNRRETSNAKHTKVSFFIPSVGCAL